jgi:Xaa-Pro aminopeptidase
VADGRSARQTALRAALLAEHLDAVLVSSLANIRYLTGFSGSNALALVTASECLLITDIRYDEQAREESGDVARVLIESQSLWAALWRELPPLVGVETIAFESAHLLHRDFARLLESGTRWRWRPAVELVEALREVKDADEVARHAEAAKIAVHALSVTLGRIHTGMSELAIAGVLEGELRLAGAEDFPFKSIVATGPRTALPHARAGSRQWGRGEFLLIDFGAVYAGYCSDVTRTVVAGPADERQRTVYGIVAGANAAARAGVRAGMSGKDADALARRYIDDAGEGAAFGHGLGHGLGLEVHEAPRLSRLSEGLLPAGAVVTIEPGIYHAGWGGVRIEDDVHLTAGGPVLLTDFTRELLEVG